MHWPSLIFATLLTSTLDVCVSKQLTGETAAEVLKALEATNESHLQSLLHWAIEHSNPEELRSQADAIWKGSSLEDLQERVRELSDFVSQQVSESDIMKEAIGVLKVESSSDSDIVLALERLQVMVERIDNANDLKSMDGIVYLIDELQSSAKRAAAAASVIGVAAANNPTFQGHLYNADPDILSKLIKMLESKDHGVLSSALYAVSSLIRNSEKLRTLFYANGGLNAVHRILESVEPVRLKRKCLTLLADLIQLGDLFIKDKGLVQLIVHLVEHADWDLAEKALATLDLLSQQAESLEALKQSNLGELLTQKRLSIVEAMHGADDRKEYFQELLNSIDALLHHCGKDHSSDLHTEL